jgi:hypothetical protein
MEEKIRNEELENMVNEISRNFTNKPHLYAVSNIISSGKGRFLNIGDINNICINETEKKVRFNGEYKDKARSMKELKPLIDYLDRNNYTWE